MTTDELRSAAASNLVRHTQVTMKEWSQILRTWGPKSGQAEQLKWLEQTYGLDHSDARTVVNNSSAARELGH